MTIRIVIVDDHAFLREGLHQLIESRANMNVVGEAGNGTKALEICKRLKPDVVLMDVGLPDMSGIDVISRLKDEGSKTAVLVLSMHNERTVIIGALKAGAAGFVVKESAFEEIRTAIEAIASGEKYLSPSIQALVIEEFLKPELSSRQLEVLTSRERQILQLIAEGKRTKDIAELLDVSNKTVDGHRTQIMKKLDLHSIAELTRFAIQNGLSTL